jgi:hypothetical protein
MIGRNVSQNERGQRDGERRDDKPIDLGNSNWSIPNVSSTGPVADRSGEPSVIIFFFGGMVKIKNATELLSEER